MKLLRILICCLMSVLATDTGASDVTVSANVNYTWLVGLSAACQFLDNNNKILVVLDDMKKGQTKDQKIQAISPIYVSCSLKGIVARECGNRSVYGHGWNSPVKACEGGGNCKVVVSSRTFKGECVDSYMTIMANGVKIFDD